MTRRPFGGTPADVVATSVNGVLRVAPVAVTFWTSQTGGVQITDLLNAGGGAVTSIPTDTSGQLPTFQGPDDGTASMWADAGGAGRALMLATDIPNRLAILEAGGAGGSGALTVVGPKTANYTALANQFVTWDTTAASYVQTLPTAPANGTQVGGKIVILGATRTVTLTCGGSDVINKAGGGTTLVLSLLDQAYTLEYTSGVWTVIGADLSLSQLDARYDATGAAAAAQAAAVGSSAQRASNLSDLASAATARANLGLGGAATLAVGTTAGTVAAGDDSRITGAAQKSANLGDLANAGTARTNLGLGTAATQASTAFDTAGAATAAQAAAIAASAQRASNLSDLASASTARTNLGLGTAATLASAAVAQTANNLSDLASANTSRTNLGAQPLEAVNFGYSGTLATATGQTRWYCANAMAWESGDVSVGTAPTGATVIVDVKKNGTSIYTTTVNRPTVATSGFHQSATAPDVTTFAAGDYITVDILQIGSTIPGADLLMTIRLRRT